MTAAETRFEDLYQEHTDEVLLYALRRTSPADAADVHSDVFLVAWRRIGDVPDPVLPWLYGVARRVLANQRRRQRRQSHLAERLRAHTPPPEAFDTQQQSTPLLSWAPCRTQETAPMPLEATCDPTTP